MKQIIGLSHLSLSPLLMKEVKKKRARCPDDCYEFTLALTFSLPVAFGLVKKKKIIVCWLERQSQKPMKNCWEKGGQWTASNWDVSVIRVQSACLEVIRWKMCDGSKKTGLYKEVHLGQWFQVCVVVLWEVPGSSTNSKNRCCKLRFTEVLPVKTSLSINACAFLYMLWILILSGDRKKITAWELFCVYWF